MTRLLSVIAGLLLVLPALAGEKAGPVDLAKAIAPLVDGQTVAVAHVRVDKLDVGRLVQLAGKLVELKPADATTAEAAARLAQVALSGAGVRDVYAVASLDGIPYDPGFVAIPVAGAEDGKRIAATLRLALNLPDGPESRIVGQMMVQHAAGFVLIAPNGMAKRLSTMKPSVAPQLVKGLAAFAGADVHIAVVCPDTLRRSLGEFMPRLPPELGGAKTAPLLSGFQYFAAGITLKPKLSVQATLTTTDAESAAGIRSLLVELMKLAGKEAAKEFPDPKASPLLEKAITLLTPKADKERLTWKMNEDDLIEAMHPLMAPLQAQASSAQSINNLKELALAMHNYHDAYKQFPTSIRDKKGKLLLSWRVQILPFIEQGTLYQQFKLDEPWDSPHNLKLVKRMPAVLRSPNSKADPDKTTYLLPAGKGLFFDSTAMDRKVQDIADGTSNTIMLLEVDDNRAVTWTKPEDLNIDPKESLKGLGSTLQGRFNAAFADGSVQSLSRRTLTPADFYKLLTIAGGEVVNRP